VTAPLLRYLRTTFVFCDLVQFCIEIKDCLIDNNNNNDNGINGINVKLSISSLSRSLSLSPSHSLFRR